MTDLLLILTFNGPRGHTDSQPVCHSEVQRSQSGPANIHSGAGDQEPHFRVYVCAMSCADGGGAVCKEKEQTDRAEREMCGFFKCHLAFATFLH